MDDLGNYKIIFYIILAILYFLFKGKKKPKVTEVPQNKPPFEQEEVKPYAPSKMSVSQPKPLLSKPWTVALPKAEEPAKSTPTSLEDLLREFGKGLEIPTEEYQQKDIKEISQEVLSPKVIDYDEAVIAEEKYKKDLENKSDEIIFGRDEHFSAYAIDDVKVNKYAEMLKDPEGAKMAFIAGEIFNRKF